jgi:hypothetical protein
MQQNELAALLNISPAMVSRLKKKGMPTDTAERAERWRRRHLEPGRIKGSRFDPTQAAEPTARKPAPAAAAVPGVSVADVEAAGIELDNALATVDQAWADVMLQQVRDSLRSMGLETDPNDKAEPRLSLRVWLALCAYVLNLDGITDRASNPAELLTPVQFHGRWRPDQPTYPLQNHHTLSHACDWNDYSIKGWPEYPDDDKWDAMAAEA